MSQQITNFPDTAKVAIVDLVHFCSYRMYLVNASSKEERDSWIEAVGRAVPSAKLSPKAPRKDEPPQRYKTKLEVARPTYTARQDTANEAALAASEQEEVNETVRANF